MGNAKARARGGRRVKGPEWEMQRTGRGGVDGLKDRSGKCEGPGGGGRRGKESEWECEGPGRPGGRPTVV